VAKCKWLVQHIKTRTHIHAGTKARAHAHAQVAVKQLSNTPAQDPTSEKTPAEQFVDEFVHTISISKKAPHVVVCLGWTSLKTGQLALIMKLYAKSLHALIEEQGNNCNIVLPQEHHS